MVEITAKGPFNISVINTSAAEPTGVDFYFVWFRVTEVRNDSPVLPVTEADR
jgi:hypothetical protein